MLLAVFHTAARLSASLPVGRASCQAQPNAACMAAAAADNVPPLPPPQPPTMFDLLIIGAGVSGLACAEAALAADPGLRVAVLEARDRVGGRLDSFEGVDLGGAWAWPPHEVEGVKLARRLGLDDAGDLVLRQRLDGEAFVSRGAGAARNVGNQGARMAPCGPEAVRFKGGYARLPQRLAEKLPAAVLTGRRVRKVQLVEPDGANATGRRIAVTFTTTAGGGDEGDNTAAAAAAAAAAVTTGGSTAAAATVNEQHVLHAARVVVAVPPAVLARSIAFAPSLPPPQLRKMQETSTWCGDWVKIVAVFRTPFWRAAGASGVVQREGRPVQIWYEGAAGEAFGEQVSALTGLGFGARACNEMGRLLLDTQEDALRAFVVGELGPALGTEVVRGQLLRVGGKAWAADDLTYAAGASGRDYGHRLLRQPTEWGVFFAGAETESLHGHVEGAIVAGKRAAREALASLAAVER